ncbi:DUF481 domain-containing protein [Luteitalea pratensis]|uniref:DUF481 domain-containing protein n=1 Tax=Luteitalea pratensis TaxID=1855912 RepID=UPI000D72CA60|nr:DUF481 domain-containing protein [Luteitalea pratensis]
MRVRRSRNRGPAGRRRRTSRTPTRNWPTRAADHRGRATARPRRASVRLAIAAGFPRKDGVVDGNENADRGLVATRLERLITERAYLFGQLGYVRDRFKDIDYLIAPTAGIGYKVVATDRTTFDVDTSLGMAFEKNTGLELETDGAVTLGEKFSHKLSANAAITQGSTALWKMDDFGDALYTFSAGLAASVTTRVQLKLEFQDVYKSRPTGDADKNDIAFITAFVYKF